MTACNDCGESREGHDGSESDANFASPVSTGLHEFSKRYFNLFSADFGRDSPLEIAMEGYAV
jgi:hypothetical protein